MNIFASLKGMISCAVESYRDLKIWYYNNITYPKKVASAKRMRTLRKLLRHMERKYRHNKLIYAQNMKEQKYMIKLYSNIFIAKMFGKSFNTFTYESIDKYQSALHKNLVTMAEKPSKVKYSRINANYEKGYYKLISLK